MHRHNMLTRHRQFTSQMSNIATTPAVTATAASYCKQDAQTEPATQPAGYVGCSFIGLNTSVAHR
ncbi:hypothetical protein EBU58_04095 [bacterium]|nr:hypothetical protein [bacterium]